MRVPLMFGPLAGYVALRLGDGDDSSFTSQDPVVFIPLCMGGMLGAVVPAPLAFGTAPLSRHHNRAVVHLPTLFHATPTLHEAVLESNKRYLLGKNKKYRHEISSVE